MNSTRMSNILFFTLLGVVTVTFLYVLRPFFFPIFWAAVLASIFEPLHKRIAGKLVYPDLAASATLLTIILIIIIPSVIIGSLLLRESIEIYNSLGAANGGDFEQSIKGFLNTIQHDVLVLRLHIDEAVVAEKVSEIARGIANYILVSLTDLTQNTLIFLLQFAVMLYTLFYFIRDGEHFWEMAVGIIPLGKGRERILSERFVRTAKSTLKVTVIIGGLQGLFGVGLLYLMGVEDAVVWGVLMVLASILPSGSIIIWGPIGLVLLVTGYIWEGIVVLAAFSVFIAIVDAYLRPRLVGKDIEIHPLLIFLSTFGGMAIFGISGFVIGPVIATLFLAIWKMHEDYYEDQLS
ncbi:MAG: AI-2E family transporter [Smithellaceae bacterium]|nr:AI-2E family transporter [Smithellaceae bacterium]